MKLLYPAFCVIHAAEVNQHSAFEKNYLLRIQILPVFSVQATKGNSLEPRDAHYRDLMIKMQLGSSAVMGGIRTGRFAGRPVALRPRLSAGLPLSAQEC